MNKQQTVNLIEDYSRKSGLKPSTIGQQAAGYRNLYESWSRTLAVEEKIGLKVRDWIEEHERKSLVRSR